MRRTVAAVLATGLMGAPAAAQAGSYDVVSCNAPGANGANNAWVGQFTSFDNNPEPRTTPTARARNTAASEIACVRKEITGHPLCDPTLHPEREPIPVVGDPVEHRDVGA